MYFFVRYTGYVMILCGIFLMLAGLAITIYGFVQHDALLKAINDALVASNSLWRVTELRFLTSLFGLFSFVMGMLVAALGQLLLIFADLANHARQTNILLRSFRSRSRRTTLLATKVSRAEHDQPVG
ncbi:MAG: hypothetical protein DDG60_15045 [Anaerolineae bacterium]|nr:MAG: hypothetical protein DDG60_15045 [Anaerolineae bacterium]